MANGNLVAGAYAAAGGNIKNRGLAATMGLSDIGKSIGKNIHTIVRAYILKRSAEKKFKNEIFDEYANDWINRTEANMEIDQDALYKLLQKERRHFLRGNKKNQDKITRKIAKWKVQYDNSATTKDRITKINFNPKLRGNAWEDWIGTSLGQSVGTWIGGKQEAVFDQDGNLGIWVIDDNLISENETKINKAQVDLKRLNELHGKLQENTFLEDEEAKEYNALASGNYEKQVKKLNKIINTEYDNSRFISIYDIEELVNRYSFDQVSRSTLDGSVATIQELASKDGAPENYMDLEDLALKIESEIIDEAKSIHSLIHDKHIDTDGGSFFNDLIGHIFSGTYADIGITKEDGENYDIDADGDVDLDDAKMIAKELVKDEESIALRKYLSSYFAQYLKNQYKKTWTLKNPA